MTPLPPIPPGESSRAKWQLVAVILALAGASVAYRLLHAGRLHQSSALFIGLPTLLALALAATPRAKSPIGIVVKGITLALLLSGIVLGEGFVCILMAAPLFYIVGIVVAAIITYARNQQRPGRTLCVLMVLLPSLEGTHERLSFARDETVSVERVLEATPAQIEGALAATPRFDRQLPLYLRLGFPRPSEVRGAGLEPGDFRRVRFGSGDLVLVVGAAGPGHATFHALSDTSPVAQWLEWRGAEVRWSATDPRHTRVVWTLRYTRRLDPAFYFKPWERYAAGLTADYLLETAATPRE
jgi:hypothetical protein